MMGNSVLITNVYLVGLSSQGELFDSISTYLPHEKVQHSLLKKFRISYRTTSLDQMDVKMKIFDATGTDVSSIVQRVKLFDGDGFFVTFSLTDIISFRKVKTLLSSIRSINSSATIILLGLNCEDTDNYQVDLENIIDICRQENVPYYQISTKDNININEAIERMGKLLIDKNSNVKESFGGIDNYI